MCIRDSFLGNRDIVGMALLEAGAGDPDKAPVLLEIRDGGTAAVAHTGPQAAHKLVNGVGKLSLIHI